jgi:hypothetical protein
VVPVNAASREQQRSTADKESHPAPPPPGQSFLERLGILYADQIRLTIVTELGMREMSPKQFYEQVGGRSYDSVRRHFVKLLEYGWLRKVREEPTERGRPIQLYRSTELAVIDDETWGGLPVSVRDAFTVQLLEEMGDRFATAVVRGTLEARRHRILSFQPRAVDEAGWAAAMAAMESCFRTLSQEQTDAKVRLEKSGEPPTLMVVEMAGFEAPPSGETSSRLPLASPVLGAPPWPHRIAKLFADPLNMAIVNELNERERSATELHENLEGDTVTGFDRRCKILTRSGWVAKVNSLTGGPRRGATENFYRATTPAATESEILIRVPVDARVGEGWGTFYDYCQLAIAAVRAGTFNARADRHMTLSTLLVDELGWRQVQVALARCEAALARIEKESKGRHDETPGVALHPAGFFIAGFAAPLEALSG